MKYLSVYILIILAVCVQCEKEITGIRIDTNDSLSFNGFFITAAYAGSVVLFINKGAYEFNTDLPNGRGAGIVAADLSTINFMDTLSLPIPSIYGAQFVLHGKYFYTFDGNRLELLSYRYGGKIMYEFYRMKDK
jgi:hypothetical protein